MPKMQNREKAIREKLGIPKDAEHVIIFGETSHWDPNWLWTSEEYFNMRIKRIIDEALVELESEPQRVFSIECVFFLKMYWEKCPDKREIVRELINNGRLRLTGSGMTTPDTTLPETESIIRDYLLGQQWMLDNGMKQEPRLAYFPDSFGHSPALPSMLESAGYKYASVCRIDGMSFPGSDYRMSSYYPRPGSSAWLLLKELQTQDFIWKAPDGTEMLTHWNAFTYFHGDNIVYTGPTKWMGILFGIPRRSQSHIAARIKQFCEKLMPLSKTPYMFCPIGMDFNAPIKGLYSLLTRYNEKKYKQTGVYAVLAGMDDYMDLVSFYKNQLPLIPFDPNPYWMGFYSARPGLKMKCKKLVKDLLLAEKLSFCPDNMRKNKPNPIAKALDSAWETAIVSNHHDFITGTTPDRVREIEQKNWLLDADCKVTEKIKEILISCPPPDRSPDSKLPKWNLHEGRLSIESDFFKMELNEAQGGCITKWIDKSTGHNLLSGVGNDLVSYEDSGGLWRMGQEFAGGTFKINERSNKKSASIVTRQKDEILEIEIKSQLEEIPMTRLMWIKKNSPVVRMKLIGSAPLKRTITVRYSTSLRFTVLTMDVPGGAVSRPLKKIFDPTFWAAKSFAHVEDPSSHRGIGVSLYSPACVSGDFIGTLEWTALRNAPKETAFGFLPVPAHPASGTESDENTFDYAVWITPRGDWRENKVYATAKSALSETWLNPGSPDIDTFADSLIGTGHQKIISEAIKPASRGEGVIIRMISYSKGKTLVHLKLNNAKIKKAWLCDSMERNLKRLEVKSGRAILSVEKTITTVRLLLEN